MGDKEGQGRSEGGREEERESARFMCDDSLTEGRIFRFSASLFVVCALYEQTEEIQIALIQACSHTPI